MTAWTDISAARLDADSPVDEDLSNDLNDNDKSIRERQLRCGIHSAGVRLALARNATTLDVTLSSNSGQSTDAIVFSSGAADGNPNFSATPTCIGLVFEELSSGADLGATGGISITCQIEEGSLSTTGFTAITTVLNAGTASGTVDFKLHWAFVGPVTSGE